MSPGTPQAQLAHARRAATVLAERERRRLSPRGGPRAALAFAAVAATEKNKRRRTGEEEGCEEGEGRRRRRRSERSGWNGDGGPADPALSGIKMGRPSVRHNNKYSLPAYKDGPAFSTAH